MGNMNKKVYMICVIALALLIPAATVFAASAADELAAERKFWNMERRIFIDKLATQRESFEEKAARLETKVIQLERDLENVTNGSDKRIEDLRSHLNERVSDIKSTFGWALGIFSIFLTLVIALLGSWVGKTIVKTTKEKAEEVTKDKVRDVVTKDLVRNIIEEKGGPLIKKIVPKLEKKWQIEIDKMREELLKKASQGTYIQFNDEDKQKLNDVILDIEDTENEEEYDFDDWFLKGLEEYEKEQYAEASELFKKAISLGENEIVLFYLAISLHMSLNFIEARYYYKKILDKYPMDEISIGNYAGLLLAQGNKEEGFGELDRVTKITKIAELIIELWFYHYAHKEDEEDQKNALQEIKILITQNVRSRGFSMKANVQRATDDGHHNPKLLSDLERVIYDKKDAKDLEKYEEWKQA